MAEVGSADPLFKLWHSFAPHRGCTHPHWPKILLADLWVVLCPATVPVLWATGQLENMPPARQ